MKYLMLGVLTFVGVSVGSFFVKNDFKKQETTLDNIVVKSATVPGNIVDDRLKKDDEPVLSNKTVIKASVSLDRVVYFNTDVSFESSQAAANQIKELQKKSKDPIWLLIDSPGGSVLDGATIISEMEASRAPVNTVCTRLCASMGAMIHSYGAKRYSLDRALLMYHPASGGLQGQLPNMLSQLTTIERFINKLVSNILTRSKLTKEQYEKLISYEMWVDAEDAVNKGLTDGIINLDIPSHPESFLSLEDFQLPPEEHKVKPRRNFVEVQMISPYVYLWDKNARKN